MSYQIPMMNPYPNMVNPAMGYTTANPNVGTQDPLIRSLEKTVNAENNAIQQYGVLMELAPNEKMRKIIETIRNDEIQHFEHFSQIYQQMTGRQPQIQQMEITRNFKQGIVDSFEDELEDSKFYQNVSMMTNQPMLQRAFLNASHDEQRHATWFMYILNQLAGIV
jgi:rubrerythrin